MDGWRSLMMSRLSSYLLSTLDFRFFRLKLSTLGTFTSSLKHARQTIWSWRWTIIVSIGACWTYNVVLHVCRLLARSSLFALMRRTLDFCSWGINGATKARCGLEASAAEWICTGAVSTRLANVSSVGCAGFSGSVWVSGVVSVAKILCWRSL